MARVRGFLRLEYAVREISGLILRNQGLADPRRRSGAESKSLSLLARLLSHHRKSWFQP
jgi:hypothetical protein